MFKDTIAPIPIELLKEYFSDDTIIFNVDYANSILKGEKLITYLSNLDVTKEPKVWHKLWAEKNMIEYKNLPLNFLKNIKFVNECQARDLYVSHKGSTQGHFGFFQTDTISDNILSDYKAKTGTTLCIKS